MTELKTLRELADEVDSFPFDADYDGRETHVIVAIAPNGYALGWSKVDGSCGYWKDNLKLWTLAPKKKVLKSFVYQNHIGRCYISDVYCEDPDSWCKQSDVKLIKILDTIEVDA